MKAQAILVILMIFLTGIFFGVGLWDRDLMIRGKNPDFNSGLEYSIEGRMTVVRALIYEARVADDLPCFDAKKAPKGIAVSQVEAISITWRWKWLNLAILIGAGLILHKILKRLPKGTVA